MPGRRPTPKNLVLLRGNPGRRPVAKDIPDPPVVQVPEPPELLSMQAREHWPEFAELLSKMHVLSGADLPALCMLCESYSIYWEAMAGVRQYGIMSITPNNYVQRSEYLNTAFKALDECFKIMSEFGLTPSSRTKVRML